jgi:hypothetical protein
MIVELVASAHEAEDGFLVNAREWLAAVKFFGQIVHR